MSQDRIYTGAIPFVADPRQAEEPPSQAAPLFLLADSQLLFWADEDGPFIDRIAACTGPGAPRAAYLGASNGDNPDFYSIFLAAVQPLGPAECRMIPAEPAESELAYLESADIILLAGGDVERGWHAFQASGVRDLIERRYHAGAVLIGISAGAVQLGNVGWAEADPDAAFPTWGLARFVVDAHAEDEGWAALRAVVRARGPGARGIGIPLGGGVILHPDHTLQAVRRAAYEVSFVGDALVDALILPPEGAER
ncbi:Type 1 glutamine amidotransferase-like domain-containing protein [Longimicrobium sp.]|uniref:Type 1 glutamine amidotransferase-like domain-containing protein n=1 Tax=Longimicrobium sp. TaxID=2029185 RepID=UPI003B3BA79E